MLPIRAVWNALRVKNMHFGLNPVPLGPRGTQGSPRGSTSKFTESKNFVNKSYIVQGVQTLSAKSIFDAMVRKIGQILKVKAFS